MIPESFIQELLARVDIVEVVERYVTLKKAGANYQACCPFHSEKTPSFTVSPSKQFYHCFGCGAHGSAIGFLMQYKGIGFVEAVEELAQQQGLTVPRHSGRAAATHPRQPSLIERLTTAARFYKERLKASPQAIAYLKGRGLSGEIAARYGLGYAPDEWQGLARAFADYDSAALVECGLVIVNDQGRRYDRFRDRIMFPIQDARGNVIGFGGRVLGAGEPKYLNSPETALFKKGEELYGLPQARRAIREHNLVIVVEGYMDVVGLAQHGIDNVVATLGTAATGHHIRRLLKLADRVVFCFDPDSAGQRAAQRAMETSLEHLVDGKRVEFLMLGGALDPDEFVRQHGRAAFLDQLAATTRLSDLLVRTLSAAHDLTSAEGRAAFVAAAQPLLQKIGAPALRLQIGKEIAQRAQMSLAELEAQCRLPPLGRPPVLRPAPAPPRPAPHALERSLLSAVLRRPERAARLPLDLIGPDNAYGAALHAIATAIEEAVLPVGNLGLVLEHFRGSPFETLLNELAADLLTSTDDEGEQEAVFSDALEQLRRRALERQVAALTAKARTNGLDDAERRILAELLARKTA